MSTNRFEKHRYITLVVVILLLLIATLAAIEWTLTLFHEAVGIEPPPKISGTRHLPIREWAPGRVKTFRAPENRNNDPLGPVDQTYQLRIDEFGFIRPSVVHDAPDMEIAFFGGSTTECLYVRPEKRFPYLVGRILESRTGLRINALNAGKSGNHTLHSTISFLGKVAPREPRFVLLMHATNDIGILGNHKTYWNRDENIAIVQEQKSYGKSGVIIPLLRHIGDRTIPYTYHVADLGYVAVREGLRRLFGSDKSGVGVGPGQVRRNITGKAAAPDETEIKRRRDFRRFFEPALESFVRLAKAWRSQPVLLTQILVTGNARRGEHLEGAFLSPEALKRGKFDHESFSSRHEYANAIVRHVAQREGALLIDLAASREWGDEDVYDGFHFTETGSRRVANIIAEALGAHIAAAPRPADATPAPVSRSQN